VELKPCPFCGHHSDSLIEWHDPKTILHPWYRIECDYCGAKGPGTDRGVHRDLWNDRAANPKDATP
jgi:Lar family restriction alleviation protein